jgi:coenzyme F420 biosynthesis associated uncharacterized protein
MIDWNVATSTGVRWARPGPQVGLAEARKVVAELRGLAAAVQEPVREVTGLPGSGDGGTVAVVDRPGWIRANVDGFRVVLDPLVVHMQERGTAPPAGSVITAVGSRVTGMQAGLILAYLAGRVLGQYELFLPPDPDAPPGAADAPAGRLTLVAPNIVMVERELGVNPHDFRRWVCLHEETHRTQFTSVAWLRPYVQQQMTEFLLASDLDPASILDRLRSAADAVAGAVRGNGESLIEAIQSPRQREILDRLTAVMTLVEGHGDYVMDAVGPKVVPSVEEIRAKFSARRVSGGRIEQAIRRILGIDLKMKQYEQGSRFVKTVVEEAGMEVFNKVWTSPETLPTRDEITSPQSWLARVDGVARQNGAADERARGNGSRGDGMDGSGAAAS